MGIAGGAFCGAVHLRARDAIRARWAGVDALVARLRGSGDDAGDRGERPGPGREETRTSAASVEEGTGTDESGASRGARGVRG
jgi:hypothetical protein